MDIEATTARDGSAIVTIDGTPQKITATSLEDARAFLVGFFAWYNHAHRHSGIGMHTPADVHHGHAHAVREQRATVLTQAYAAHPERFVRHHPVPHALPVAAWINKPPDDTNSTNPNIN